MSLRVVTELDSSEFPPVPEAGPPSTCVATNVPISAASDRSLLHFEDERRLVGIVSICPERGGANVAAEIAQLLGETVEDSLRWVLVVFSGPVPGVEVV